MLLFKQQTALGLFLQLEFQGKEMSMQMQNSKNTVLAFFFFSCSLFKTLTKINSFLNWLNYIISDSDSFPVNLKPPP